jgi:3-hydroxy acid dehydrogenase/malonic semialdehyde reductase
MDGRIALVTGASAGIGRATVLALARSGFDVIAVARRLERLEALAVEVEGMGRRLFPLGLDLQDRSALDALPDSLPEDWRRVDLLVNNAGLALGADPLVEGDPADWDRVLETNVRALLVLARRFLPGMLARRCGHLVNLGSIAARQPYPGGAVYCASKAAELALSRALSMELVATPLRVTTIDPGLVETEFSLVRFRGDRERAHRVYHDIQALQPEDVADVVAWVATRPAHVQIGEIVLTPSCQATTTLVHRGPFPA